MKARDIIVAESILKAEFEAGQIHAPVHFCGGNERQLIRIFQHIGKEDYVFSTHRNHYHYYLHTGKVGRMYDEIVDSDCYQHGICGGNARSMHFTDREHNFFSSGIVAGLVAVAVGVAFALRNKRNKRKKVWCFIGDGACDEGWFYEAHRYAVGQDLPITFIIEDNDRSCASTTKERWGKKDKGMKKWSTAEKVIYYQYKPMWPHVGSGKWVTF